MAQKPETRFRAKLRKHLDKIPNTWWESIQQVGISGTPDILGCVGRYFVAIEVKTDDGVSSKLQTHKRNQILKTGALAYVVTPSNMDDILVRLAKMAEKESNLCLM